MGQTLTNGIYLPAEGEVRCYDGLASNWTTLDAVVGGYRAHVANENIHITSEERSKWDTGVTQAYVLRYASVSLTALGTVAFSALDNTDNVKIGDKVLDSEGKLFALTAVDTANSTATLSALLIDLSKDSDLSNYYTKPETDTLLNGKADASALTAHTGDTTIHVTAADKQTWNGKQDALSQTQLDAVNSGIDSTKVQQIATNTSDISSLQSGKANDSDVVHKSGNETIAGNKTFSDSITFSSVNIEDIRWKSLVNQTVDLNDCYIPKAGAISGYYTTDISSGANISNKATNSAFTMISLTTRRVSASDYQVRQVFYGSGAKYIRTCSNGTWSAWINETDKYVTTDTNQTITGTKTFSEIVTAKINGLTPSSLGMPVAPSSTSYVDISSYITVLDSSAPNKFTPPSNGYITFHVKGSQVQILHNNGLQGKWSIQAGSVNRGFIPVLGGVEIQIYTTITDIYKFWFIPCQGNV